VNNLSGVKMRFKLLFLMLLAGSEAFAVDKVIDGGAGTDSLTINYSGISGLGDFSVSESGDYVVLTDPSENTVSFKNVQTLTVGSYLYVNDTSSKTYHNVDEKILFLYLGGNASSSHAAFSAMYGNTDNWTITGSGLADSINLNLQRDPGFATTVESVRGTHIGGLLTVNLGAGNDTISSAKLANGDSIDMGAGDDLVSPMFGADAGGIQTFANVSLAKLDGGSGTDTLSFNESANPPSVITFNTANAVNFENINGTGYAETITGDDNSNLLKGFGGADTLNGQGGDDFLLPGNNSEGGSDRSWLVTPSSGATLTSSLNFITKFYTSDSASEVINGGSGNDILIGATGEDTLDGGAGRDHMAGGAGIDVFVIRSGDGSTNIDEADIIYDFTNGSDLIGMSGLNYSELTISEGTGSYAGYTLIKKTDTGEYLALISNASFSFTLSGTSYSFTFGNLDESDFSAILR
jgi:Ca2+-binding RTX toxin-like protein